MAANSVILDITLILQDFAKQLSKNAWFMNLLHFVPTVQMNSHRKTVIVTFAKTLK
jgi:hypothetical protein